MTSSADWYHPLEEKKKSGSFEIRLTSARMRDYLSASECVCVCVCVRAEDITRLMFIQLNAWMTRTYPLS